MLTRKHGKIHIAPRTVKEQQAQIQSSFRPTDQDLRTADDETKHQLSGLELYLIVVGLSLSVLLIALVRNIGVRNDCDYCLFPFRDRASFTPRSLNNCACQPLAGKVFQYFSLKWGYLSFLSIFDWQLDLRNVAVFGCTHRW